MKIQCPLPSFYPSQMDTTSFEVIETYFAEVRAWRDGWIARLKPYHGLYRHEWEKEAGELGVLPDTLRMLYYRLLKAESGLIFFEIEDPEKLKAEIPSNALKSFLWENTHSVSPFKVNLEPKNLEEAKASIKDLCSWVDGILSACISYPDFAITLLNIDACFELYKSIFDTNAPRCASCWEARTPTPDDLEMCSQCNTVPS